MTAAIRGHRTTRTTLATTTATAKSCHDGRAEPQRVGVGLLPQTEHREQQQGRHRLLLAAGAAQLVHRPAHRRTARAASHRQQPQRRGHEGERLGAAPGSPTRWPTARSRHRRGQPVGRHLHQEVRHEEAERSRRRTARTVRPGRRQPGRRATAATVSQNTIARHGVVQTVLECDAEQADQLRGHGRQQQGGPVRAQPLRLRRRAGAECRHAIHGGCPGRRRPWA